MDPKDREMITTNILTLTNTLEFHNLEGLLLERGIFTEIMLNDIRNVPSDKERVLKMLLELPCRGPLAFEKFVKILLDTDNHEAAMLLNANVAFANGNYNGDGNHLVEPMEVSNHNINNNRNSNQQIMPVFETDTRRFGGEGQMSIQCATQIVESPDHFKMDAKPRGYCIIINNVSFDNDNVERKGSDSDAKGLDMIFQQLFFNVILRRNLKSQEILDLIQNLADKDHSSADAAVIIILSHGLSEVILGTDGIEVPLDNLLNKLNNENCKGLTGKPKMFFIQACRGTRFDHGTPIIPEPVVQDASKATEGRSSTLIVGAPTLFANLEDRTAHCTDMLVSYSTVRGYVSNRNEVLGSWYGRAIIESFIEKAHDSEIHEILNLVDRKVQSRVGLGGQKQATSRELIGWNKSLYFNPGLFR